VVIVDPDTGYEWRAGDRVVMQAGSEMDGAMSFITQLFPGERWGAGPSGDHDSHWALLANGWMIRLDLIRLY
jgi:hypothetical protein